MNTESPRPAVTRTALITGSSRGLGRASAIELSRRGWRVIAAMRSPERDFDGLADAVRTFPGAIAPLQLDLVDERGIGRAASEVQDVSIDALIHVAGVAPIAAFEDTSHDESLATFQVNLFGPMRLTAALLPAMRERGRGRVVAVGSSSARVGFPFSSMYGASKAALARWMESLNVELSSFGVTAHVVEAGAFATDLLEGAVPPAGGPYGDIYARVLPQRERFLRMAKPPETFACALADVVEASNPPFLKLVGRDAWATYVAQRLMPSRALNGILRSTLGRSR